ncbi:hypothetical protein DVH05_014633 [Phytophthora capsici]|nr:hypothetical protein DVH05_014633 [Phytophthora capsici]
MKRRIKNKNKVKLKGVKAAKTTAVSTVAINLGVHRSAVYRWRKQESKLQADKKNGSKYYVSSKTHLPQRVRYPVLEERLLEYVSEMRKNRKLCVTTECLILMMAKFDPSFTRARNYVALRSWTARFLKRNRLVIRRVTHKGSKTRSDMQVCGVVVREEFRREGHSHTEGPDCQLTEGVLRSTVGSEDLLTLCTR